MFKKEKLSAILESKTIIENKTAPLIGGQSIIFASAEQSQSFMSKDIFYTLTFRVGECRKEFRVPKDVYERVEEGDEGMLEYDGAVFYGFTASCRE